MSKQTSLLICLVAIGMTGCAKSGSELVGMWTGETSHKDGKRYQITMTLNANGTETLQTVPEGAGLTVGEPVMSNGRYTVEKHRIIQHLDAKYPQSEIPIVVDPGSAAAPILTAFWVIDDTGALVLAQPSGNMITLHKV